MALSLAPSISKLALKPLIRLAIAGGLAVGLNVSAENDRASSRMLVAWRRIDRPNRVARAVPSSSSTGPSPPSPGAGRIAKHVAAWVCDKEETACERRDKADSAIRADKERASASTAENLSDGADRSAPASIEDKRSPDAFGTGFLTASPPELRPCVIMPK